VRGPGGDGGGAVADALEAAAEDPAKAGEDDTGDPEGTAVSRETAGTPAPHNDRGVEAGITDED
jgi:hypothetical protein